jgi:hypothetical protein
MRGAMMPVPIARVVLVNQFRMMRTFNVAMGASFRRFGPFQQVRRAAFTKSGATRPTQTVTNSGIEPPRSAPRLTQRLDKLSGA